MALLIAGTPRERLLLKRRPFDQRGQDGYRDVLIWETVLELSREPRLRSLAITGIDITRIQGRVSDFTLG